MNFDFSERKFYQTINDDKKINLDIVNTNDRNFHKLKKNKLNRNKTKNSYINEKINNNILFNNNNNNNNKCIYHKPVMKKKFYNKSFDNTTTSFESDIEIELDAVSRMLPIDNNNIDKNEEIFYKRPRRNNSCDQRKIRYFQDIIRYNDNSEEYNNTIFNKEPEVFEPPHKIEKKSVGVIQCYKNKNNCYNDKDDLKNNNLNNNYIKKNSDFYIYNVNKDFKEFKKEIEIKNVKTFEKKEFKNQKFNNNNNYINNEINNNNDNKYFNNINKNINPSFNKNYNINKELLDKDEIIKKLSEENYHIKQENIKLRSQYLEIKNKLNNKNNIENTQKNDSKLMKKINELTQQLKHKDILLKKFEKKKKFLKITKNINFLISNNNNKRFNNYNLSSKRNSSIPKSNSNRKNNNNNKLKIIKELSFQILITYENIYENKELYYPFQKNVLNDFNEYNDNDMMNNYKFKYNKIKKKENRNNKKINKNNSFSYNNNHLKEEENQINKNEYYFNEEYKSNLFNKTADKDKFSIYNTNKNKKFNKNINNQNYKSNNNNDILYINKNKNNKINKENNIKNMNKEEKSSLIMKVLNDDFLGLFSK